MRKISLLVAACFALGACTQQLCDTWGPDPGCGPTKVYAYYEKEGFTLKLTHSRYQWVTDMHEIIASCERSIEHYGKKYAAAKGHEIESVDNSKSEMTYDRDSAAAVSSCSAVYDIAYK